MEEDNAVGKPTAIGIKKYSCFEAQIAMQKTKKLLPEKIVPKLKNSVLERTYRVGHKYSRRMFSSGTKSSARKTPGFASGVLMIRT